MNREQITSSLVKDLISKQFPQWKDLEVHPVDQDGWDNCTFRLGSNMSVRLPSSEGYSFQPKKEFRWLPYLKSHLNFNISSPIAMGNPSDQYPWNWTINQWIEGNTLNSVKDQSTLAESIGQFLVELQSIDSSNGPTPSKENFFRGGDLREYNEETIQSASNLKDFINENSVLRIWNTALESKWNTTPVWVHGDFHLSNLLFKNDQLEAVIDFGSMAIGDPACDLSIAWTALNDESREEFKKILNLDTDTWIRGLAWTLWKALITMNAENKNSNKFLENFKLIQLLESEFDSLL